MTETVIKIENLSKQYRLGVISTGTLSHDLNRWWTMNILRKDDPYLKVGEINRRDKKGSSDYVWALKDINLDVHSGDVIGIIGRNGAGKSTLLKILSRVTKPTTGMIRYRGRIASLLEVGTGFHAEMTGRENIYMNGAIMGMSKREISRKLDEIVAFSGCERYLDTPVKRYSSGMTVRLGFAIAAHVDPDILVVDEVLAVGDAEFQKKAIGKMQDVSRGEGKTVLFVSHNMTAVRNLCKTGIVLKDGMVDFTGSVDDAVNHYLKTNVVKGIHNNFWTKDNAPGTAFIKVKSAYVEFEGDTLTTNKAFSLVTEFWCEEANFPINVSMHIYNNDDLCIFNISTHNIPLSKGLHKSVIHIPANLMNDGLYYVNNMFVNNSRSHFLHIRAHSFEIEDARKHTGWYGKWAGAVRPLFCQTDLV